MKRITSIIIFTLIICAVPFSGTLAQEKKSEQKIKIIVSDGSGTEVVIDTLIKDGETNDSIRIKGGKVIYIGHSGDETGIKHNDDSEHVYVYVSSDNKEKNKDAKTITIVSSEPGSWSEKNGDSDVIIMKKADHAAGTGKSSSYSHYSFSKTESDMADNYDTVEDMTRSVIAKDGMVVTVEGKDEAKVNELAKEIQKKMGVKPDESSKKQTVKEEKKSVKK
jgi:hypothetical protein